MSGSGSGSAKRASRDAGTAPRLDSTKRMLRLDGWASVTDVGFDAKGVIVTLKLRKRRRRTCSVCGQNGHLEIVDYRTKRWRDLDPDAC